MQKPIVISCGEPAGIGTEIFIKAWHKVRNDFGIVWIGDPSHLPANIEWNEYSQSTPISAQALSVIPIAFPAPNTLGQAAPQNAPQVQEAIRIGVFGVLEGQFSALCTCPIHKKTLKDGSNFPFPGHTEYLAHLTKSPQAVMMLAGKGLRVVPLSIHIPLKDVPAQITAPRICNTVQILARELRDKMGIQHPRIWVTGLNPHAGEGGAMGQEEKEIIAPAIAKLQAMGINIQGPFSADTMFHTKARAQYDLALCMYHDQALIPLKTLDFEGGVNVTLGLPIIRTSPDHGTAFDIAGGGKADPTSMIAALRMAHDLAKAKV